MTLGDGGGIFVQLKMQSTSDELLSRILAKVSLRDMIILGRVNRQWRKVSQLLIDSSSICFLYRFQVGCDYPAKIALEANCCDPEKSVKICRLDDFLNSTIADRVVRVACFYPIVESDSTAAVLADPFFMILRKLSNIRTLEFTGNNTNVFYAGPSRPTIKYLFPRIIDQLVVYCNFPDFKLRIESSHQNDFLPTVQLQLKDDHVIAVASAFAKIDEFIEQMRAEGLVNEDKFINTVAMRELAAMMPLASLKFAIPTELDGTSVLSTVFELRLVVGENHNLTATLTQLPKLKILELSDERRCSCVVRLPPMPQLISLTLAIHKCPSDRNLLAMVPKLENLQIYSEGCGGIWLELLALNMPNLPMLTSLILNCWDQSKMFGTADSDDILPDLLSGAERLKKLFLGPGVQPTIGGLNNILAKCQLSLVEADLSASINIPDDIEKLIGLISRSTVEILRTKIGLTIDDLTKIVVNLLNNYEPKLIETVSKPAWKTGKKKSHLTHKGKGSKTPGKKSVPTVNPVNNSIETSWESGNDVVVKSRLISNSNLFRIRKVPLSRPLGRLKQLRSRGFRLAQVGCEIPQLCGPDGPSFTCGGCEEDSKIQILPPHRSADDLSAKMKSLSLLTSEEAQPSQPSEQLNYVLWLHWNNKELKRHFDQINPTGKENVTGSDSNCHPQWIRFLCAT